MCITRGICRANISLENVVGKPHPGIPVDDLGTKVVSRITPLSVATSTKALLMPCPKVGFTPRRPRNLDRWFLSLRTYGLWCVGIIDLVARTWRG
ncbi:hypothetical protein RSOLAG1IB_03661 [Rhizoctonia solani AG-1 IB]|uniref:Uncharacterized protein n=1 Tax=Thanatephorus cucumeris (strain AG1-IB / isolate 7/3/14) TaxID=1108050 RepID=A0A0B7FU25_THACB|nr:hypothetical protein RSOLAG1IB_03661 [Rhizoctonia solani AG-1 IB]